jgi:hypothetical protein
VDYNPYADFTTHKINQILAEGGFAPEWVMLRFAPFFYVRGAVDLKLS